MGTCLKAIALIILISTEISAQGMWNEFEPSIESFMFLDDFELDSLKSIILNDNDESDFNIYIAATEYIYFNHRTTEKEFLLEHLKTSPRKTDNSINDYFSWHKYYSDTYIKGLLGDTNAIENMISIAQNGPDSWNKERAIWRLAETGIYNYYALVKDQYLKTRSNRIVFSLYGRDSRYKDEVHTILLAELKSMNSNNWSEIIHFSFFIGELNQQMQIDLLNNYFELSEGELSWNYFKVFEAIDKNGQPERSLFALQNELNDNFRGQYIPDPKELLVDKWYSELYLEPAFVHSLQQVPMEPGSLTFARRTAFMNGLKPPQPDSTDSINDMLDQITNYTDQCYQYEWIGNKNFKNELIEKISNAKKYLDENNLTDCFNEINSFQKSVEEVHSGAKRNNAEAVSVAGYKFLYHYAQYILDRLN